MCSRPGLIPIEAAASLPLRGGVGIADAQRDCADMNVAVIDQPGLLPGVRIAAAGKGARARLSGSPLPTLPRSLGIYVQLV
jgi:hypothetical protein